MSGVRLARLDRLEHSFERHLALLRGALCRARGAQAGARFGIGRGVRLLHPGCFHAEADVSIEDYSYLHCLSARGVWFGEGTSADRNLWLHCGGTPDCHDHGFVRIGRHSYIGCNAVLGAGGGITIGSHVLIGQCVNLHAENHRFSKRTALIGEQGVEYGGIVIEDDVWIGSRATILDGVSVGQGAVIGAGAVVTRSVPPYAIAAGMPARVVGERGAEPG